MYMNGSHDEKPYVNGGVKAEEEGDGDFDVEAAVVEPISDEDIWTIIGSFFEGGKGLVRQQLESFNEFVENTMQEIVDENQHLVLDQHKQYTDREGDVTVSP